MSDWNDKEAISDEAWARGVRPEDICEGMPAAITHWGAVRAPATVVEVKRAQTTGRILEVVARREDIGPEAWQYIGHTLVRSLAKFTYRTWGGLVLKGATTGSTHGLRLIVGTMPVLKES